MIETRFPVYLVHSTNPETRVQRARRASGEAAGRGALQLASRPGQCRIDAGNTDSKPMATLLLLGIERLETWADAPVVRSIVERAFDNHKKPVSVQWMRNHCVIADTVMNGEAQVRFDLGWAKELSEDNAAPLAALAILYIFATLGGANQREALRLMLDCFDAMPESDREALLGALASEGVDANNVFRLFLQLANDQTMALELEQLSLSVLRGARTDLLFQLGDALENARFTRRAGEGGGDPISLVKKQLRSIDVSKDEIDALIQRLNALPRDNGSLSMEALIQVIEKTLRWRDKWVSWLMGQERVNVPYNQERVVRLMAEPIEDIDEKRALINEAVTSTYDTEIEGENIQRIVTWTREQEMRLAAGRLSRAFGNQSQLLSAAKMLADKQSLLPHVRQLHQASMGLRPLQTHATRLLHLIQQRKPTPFAQSIGALNQFEEALFEFQNRECRQMLQTKDDASRRIIGRPDASACEKALDALQDQIRRLYAAAAAFRDQLERTPTLPAAYIILLQRLHPAETVNLANANLLLDVHPGKEEDLRDLMRQGGHQTYSSPGPGRMLRNGVREDGHWIIEVDDWVEAIPLFIHERVVKRTVKAGGGEVEIEVIETEVDQDAMEVFFRLHAEYWACNLDAVMDSQRVGLARRWLARMDSGLQQAVESFRKENPDQSADAAALAALIDKPELHEAIAGLAALLRVYEESRLEEIARRVESDDVPRVEALERVALDDRKTKLGRFFDEMFGMKSAATASKAILRMLEGMKKAVQSEAERLAPLCVRATRRTPSLHILTTESAGMTEGYVQTWIEEEMALYNAIRDQGLEAEVDEEIRNYRARTSAIARKVIAEFGMSVVIDEVMAQQRLPEPAAVMTVLFSYKPLMTEAAKLGVLLHLKERNKKKIRWEKVDDPSEVEEILKKRRSKLMKAAVPQVAENNGKAFEQKVEALLQERPKLSRYEACKRVIAGEDEYNEELEAMLRFEARNRALEAHTDDCPELRVRDMLASYLRIHTALAKSTARKRVLARHGLQAMTLDPRNHYQAAGGNKRYNLLYTPSRVNLGERERDSVVKWRQWVGGADRWAAQEGFEFYSLINEGGVEERPALAYAEIQKTSENALCVTHFAGSNALALLCMAVMEGDAEDMADQMNLRHDRMVPPAGEGYGGYCVPKDGLFLAFVLELRNEVKLRQMGVPERFHDGVMALAKEVLLHQNDFESHFDWQRWAAEKLLKFSVLKKYFDLREDVLVFHITKIARAVENLGRPWHETSEGSKLLANLAAQWGVERMIIRAEQVNRFMVFYKAWMIYDALREAREENPLCAEERSAAIALSAEYKPVQDVRYSTGLRLFEILAQTGEHLTYSLDEEGQNLAFLMMHGFAPDSDNEKAQRAARQVMQAFDFSEKEEETLRLLKEKFPSHASPGDIMVISSTLSSTQDMLHYTSDAKLEEIAQRVQTILTDYGLTEDQMRANATVHGGRLRRWAGVKNLPQKEQDELMERVGGDIHALVLQLRGPGRDYERDAQGIDVLNTGIPFQQLLDLLDDPPKLIALMRNGNPHSALAITDGAAGRARRALTFMDVMLFFASCERIGRQGIYRAIGLGKSNIERLREEMRRKRERAQRLYLAVEAVAEAAPEDEPRLAAEALARFAALREEIVGADEAGKALREEEKMKRYKKWKPRDYYICQALAKISAGLPLGQMDFGTWLAGTGGLFVTVGEPRSRIEGRRHVWNAGVEAIQRRLPEEAPENVHAFNEKEMDALSAAMIRPEYQPDAQRFSQEMLVETSSKAVEIAAREALERRKALKARAERARALGERETGFRETFREGDPPAFDQTWELGEETLRGILADLDALHALPDDSPKRRDLQTRLNRACGRVVAHARMGLARLAQDILPDSDADERSIKRLFFDDLALVFTGRELILENIKKLLGGYEDIGGVARLAEAAKGDRATLETLAKAVELFYAAFAMGQTLEFAVAARDEIEDHLFWKNYTDFFAEAVNDHWYEYWPWVYCRGVGFQTIPRDELMALAVERHQWLYGFMRRALVRCSELRDWDAADLDALIGDYTDGHTVAAIGANAHTEDERRWRAFNQLREIAFIKNDGFALPPVFHDFDPDWIDAKRRVNFAILFPVGRTHVSRALREGPTLSRELQAEGRPGANIVITRYNDFVETPGAKRKALMITDGHLYISEKEFRRALESQPKAKKSQVKQRLNEEREAGRLTGKGIRIAARFMKKGEPAPILASVLAPFHGLPLYVDGQSEAEGMPASIQSRILSDITYDKSLYPEIFIPESHVELPPEIDWKREWNQNRSEGEILRTITEGDAELGFSGLRAFASEHGVALIKGAAESGARNLKVFEVQDEAARVDEAALLAAARFVFEVSKSQNVVIQGAVLTSPELWASPELMESFIDRQILDWNRPVRREAFPRSAIYGSLRIVASSPHPDQPYDTAFPIGLVSLQVATNVGRGGTLEPLRPEFIQERYRKRILEGLHAEGPKVMKAVNEYVAKHGPEWERRTGMSVGEDLRGVSYGWANYLMSDYLLTPVFKRRGRLVEIRPEYDDTGRRIGSVPIMQDEGGRFEGEIVDWRFIHLEPNVGIGLWDRYNLREEFYEARDAEREGREFNWDNVGRSDRIVLRNFILAGEAYREALFSK